MHAEFRELHYTTRIAFRHHKCLLMKLFSVLRSTTTVRVFVQMRLSANVGRSQRRTIGNVFVERLRRGMHSIVRAQLRSLTSRSSATERAEHHATETGSRDACPVTSRTSL